MNKITFELTEEEIRALNHIKAVLPRFHQYPIKILAYKIFCEGLENHMIAAAQHEAAQIRFDRLRAKP